jgi:nucleotide-binding universal stress UspA family protein
MTATDPTIIRCPVCGSHGAALRHDVRASLVYGCQNCLHEWQIDPAEEPPEAKPPTPGSPRPALARGTPPRSSLRRGSATPSAPFRRIAVCVDGSEMDDTIVRHAAGAAEAFGVPLTTLRVLEPDSNADAPPDPLDWDVRQREARADLNRLLSLARQRPIEVLAELIQGRAAEQICLWALQHNADLVVLASHGEHGPSAWPLSSTARKLVDGVPGSLLLVPSDGDREERSAVRYRRVMVPLDGSTRAESVLPIATRLALAHEADVLVAHVTPAPELTRVGPLTAQDLELEQRVIARNERVARGYLDQIRARISEAGVTARVVVSHAGDPRTRLARLVRREGVDLVVLSAYGWRGPRDTPCGSVTAHLLTHVATPLLVVRERPRRVMKRLSTDAAGRTVSVRPPAQVVA